MRKTITALALFAALLLPASGQLSLRGVGGGFGASAGGGFVGPGDVKAGAVAFYSCRAYSNAVKGTKALRVIRASDAAQQDFNSNASTGLCDNSGMSTFCASTVCFVVTYYDQSGANACGGSACDVTAPSTPQQPILDPGGGAGPGGNACPSWNAAARNTLLQSAGTLTQTQPFTVVDVFNRNITNVGFPVHVSDGGNMTVNQAANNQTVTTQVTTSFSQSATDGTFHSYVGVFNTGSSASYVDAASQAGSVSAGSFSGTVRMGNISNLNVMDGYFCELGIWSGAYNSTDASNYNTNVRSAANGFNF